MQKKWVIPLTLIGVGFFLLLVASSESTKELHFRLADFYKEKEKREFSSHTPLTLYGIVQEGSLIREGVFAEFVLEEKGYTLKVEYQGKELLPDSFGEGREVAISGYYLPKEGKFLAEKAMAKCASKYQAYSP